MDALGALGMIRSVAADRLRRPAAALVLGALACNVCAAEHADGVVGAQAFVPASDRPQMQMSASSLPRFDSTDGATRSSRIDLTLLPTRQSTLGPSLAMTRADPRGLLGIRPFAGDTTRVDLGLHWRSSYDSNYRFDVTAWRRMSPVDAASLIENRESSYGARVEMDLASTPRSGFVADHRFLGFQLESGARITLRKSTGGGKPMVYYRSNF
jgi:hypothetical protein